MKPIENMENLIRKLRYQVGARAHDRLLGNVLGALEKQEKQKPAAKQTNIWRIIMKNKITKFTVAAAIIIGVFISVNQFSGSIDGAGVAFAEVVEPLLTVETGAFNMTIDVVSSGLDWINCGDQPVQTIEVIFAGSGRTRWNVPTGETLVANMHEGKVMILIPTKKQGAVMQVGPPGVIPPHNRFNKLFELRRLIRYALQAEDESVEFLGESQIEGIAVIGYHITGPEHHGDITVWADAETKVPIRIEQSMDTETALISDIAYDVELDELLFSVEMPEEYSAGQGEPEEDEQPKFVVRGTVTDAVTGEPIANAKVSDDGYGPQPYKGATTDSEGRYEYFTWPEEHSIKAEAPGYNAQRKGLTGLFHVETEDQKVIDFALDPE